MSFTTDVLGMMGWDTKANRGQPIISRVQPSSTPTLQRPVSVSEAYRNVPMLNRAANMVIDSAAECTYEVGDNFKGLVSYGQGIKQATLDRLLNVKPNPYMDIDTFRRLVITDLLFLGTAYIHFDGTALYHLPAIMMKVVADSDTYISHYEFGNSKIKYSADEIIFVKDNAFVNGLTSQITGQSRLQATLDSVTKRKSMLQFKDTFLANGTVIGLILETDDVLNKKLKERAQEEIQLNYNPNTGQASVLILDGGLKAKPYSQISSFKDLDFKDDILRQEKDICVALGVPQVLIDGGNNANIRPNVELFYYMTIIPMLRKFASAVQFFFGFPVTPETKHVRALTPDKEGEGKFVTSLVNNGLLTGNEGRNELGKEPLEDPRMDEIRIPANISGSATAVSGQEGGRPSTAEEDDK